MNCPGCEKSIYGIYLYAFLPLADIIALEADPPNLTGTPGVRSAAGDTSIYGHFQMRNLGLPSVI
jgi:hypothetical protein